MLPPITSSTLLTTREAARRLGLAPGSLANLRSRGQGPIYVRLKGRGTKGRGAIRYLESDLVRYIEQCRTEQRP